MPDDEIAFKIIARAQVPVICPSANISGKPAPVTFADAIRDLEPFVDPGSAVWENPERYGYRLLFTRLEDLRNVTDPDLRLDSRLFVILLLGVHVPQVVLLSED